VYEYAIEVERVVDGDTLDLHVDLGFKVGVRVRVRLHGVDTPETYGVKKHSEEWEAGVRAKAFVEHWLATQVEQGRRLVMRSHDGKDLGTGKYGRWLATIDSYGGGTCRVLNDLLVEEGHATRVDY